MSPRTLNRHAGGRGRSVAVRSSTFHRDRMKATHVQTTLPRLPVCIATAETDEELEAVSSLRARSFYAYPPERAFAGKRHQLMKTQEEFEALKARRLEARLGSGSRDRFTCLMATASVADMPAGVESVPEDLILVDSNRAVVGTVDVVVARALEGQVLIGKVSHAAYIANLCTAGVARRRGVAGELVKGVRAEAKRAGVDALYVHVMAVNEAARAFYESCGFEVEKEESSNQAHYRGHCLDGVEGLGRVVLLRDMQLTSDVMLQS